MLIWDVGPPKKSLGWDACLDTRSWQYTTRGNPIPKHKQCACFVVRCSNRNKTQQNPGEHSCLVMDTCSTKGCRIFERLISIHLIEERDEEWDDIGHYFWRWTYPMIETETRKFIEKRLHSRFVHFSTNSSDHHAGKNLFQLIILKTNAYCCMAEDFIYYNNDSKWIYICCNSLSSGRFVLVLLTTDFYPNVYKEFLSLFAQLYQQKISPKKLLNYYLTLMIEEQVVISELANLKYTLANSASPKSGECQIKPIIKLFHLDVILIFTALLLKRKIAVYHHNQSILYDFVSALPLFVPHRPECQHKVLVPNVDIYCLDQINDLKSKTQIQRQLG